MSELGDSIHKLHLTNEGVTITGTITQITAISTFNTGWIGQPFLYESPELYVNCDTEFGTIQLEIELPSLNKSGIKSLLENAPMLEFSTNTLIDINKLIGEKIYIAPDEDKKHATISWDKDIQYNDTTNISFRSDEGIRDVQNIIVEDRTETGSEPRSIEWMNHLLTVEYIRSSTGENGWIEVPFDYIGEEKNKHFFRGILPTGKSIYWTFESHFSGIENVDDFLSELDIQYTPNEFENETIWVKPIRDLEPHNKPEELLQIDTNEFWMASSKPLPQKKRQSIFNKLKNIVKITNHNVTGSSSMSRPRRAKSSHTCDTPTPSKTDSKIIANNNALTEQL